MIFGVHYNQQNDASGLQPSFEGLSQHMDILSILS